MKIPTYTTPNWEKHGGKMRKLKKNIHKKRFAEMMYKDAPAALRDRFRLFDALTDRSSVCSILQNALYDLFQTVLGEPQISPEYRDKARALKRRASRTSTT
jgi:hypothetical protein